MPNRFLSSLQQQCGVGLVGVDRRMLWVNPGLGEMLGYEPHELTGRSIEEITHPDDIALDAHLAERLNKSEIGSYEFSKRFIDKSGSPVTLRMVASIIRDREGRPLYSVVIIDSPYQFPGMRASSAGAALDPRDLDRIRNAILM